MSMFISLVNSLDFMNVLREIRKSIGQCKENKMTNILL